MPGRRPGLVAAAALCLTAACSATPEEQVLTRFFAASRALDSTALHDLATVTFNPRTEGSIQTFTIADRGTEQHAPLSDSMRDEARRSLDASTDRDIDLSTTAVEMVTREVTVEADVRSPNGTIAPGALIVTLRRAVGVRAGERVEGRWIVTRLRRAPAARTWRAASSAPPS